MRMTLMKLIHVHADRAGWGLQRLVGQQCFSCLFLFMNHISYKIMKPPYLSRNAAHAKPPYHVYACLVRLCFLSKCQAARSSHPVPSVRPVTSVCPVPLVRSSRPPVGPPTDSNYKDPSRNGTDLRPQIYGPFSENELTYHPYIKVIFRK